MNEDVAYKLEKLQKWQWMEAIDNEDTKEFVLWIHHWQNPANPVLSQDFLRKMMRRYFRMNASAKLEFYLCFPFFKLHRQSENMNSMFVISKRIFKHTSMFLEQLRNWIDEIFLSRNPRNDVHQLCISKTILDKIFEHSGARRYVPETYFDACGKLRDELSTYFIKVLSEKLKEDRIEMKWRDILNYLHPRPNQGSFCNSILDKNLEYNSTSMLRGKFPIIEEVLSESQELDGGLSTAVLTGRVEGEHCKKHEAVDIQKQRTIAQAEQELDVFQNSETSTNRTNKLEENPGQELLPTYGNCQQEPSFADSTNAFHERTEQTADHPYTSSANQSQSNYDDLFDFLNKPAIYTYRALKPKKRKGRPRGSKVMSSQMMNNYCSIDPRNIALENGFHRLDGPLGTVTGNKSFINVEQNAIHNSLKRRDNCTPQIEEGRKQIRLQEDARPSSTCSSPGTSSISTPSSSSGLNSPAQQTESFLTKAVLTSRRFSKFDENAIQMLFKNVECVRGIGTQSLRKLDEGPTVREFVSDQIKAETIRKSEKLSCYNFVNTGSSSMSATKEQELGLNSDMLDATFDFDCDPEDISLEDLLKLVDESETQPADEQTRAEHSIAMDNSYYILEDMPSTNFETVPVNINSHEDDVKVVYLEEIEDTGNMWFEEPKEDAPTFRAEEIDRYLNLQKMHEQQDNSITTKEYTTLTNVHSGIF